MPRATSDGVFHGRALSVLIVDDEPLCVGAAMRVLKREPRISMRVAIMDPGMALEMIEKGFRPDLIVTDYHMPGMNGSQFVRALRARRLETPVVLCSAEANLGADFEEADFAAFIRKGDAYGPLLLSVVRETLGLAEHMA